MKRIGTALMMALCLIMVLACGSANRGTPIVNSPGYGPQGEAIGVTCADIVNDVSIPCGSGISNSPAFKAMEDVRVAQTMLDIGNAPSATFIIGNVPYNDFVINQIEVDNYTTDFQYFYVSRDYSNIIGCEAENIKSMSYRYTIQPMITKDFGSLGTMFDICAEKNAEGSFITVALYNASHLEDDELGDPSLDQVLFNTTIWFDMVNSPGNP